MNEINELEKLVRKGEDLEKDFIINDLSIKTTRNLIDLSTWIYEVVFWLEEKKPNSEVTKEVKRDFKQISNEYVHYKIYQTTLGSLKGLINSENN